VRGLAELQVGSATSRTPSANLGKTPLRRFLYPVEGQLPMLNFRLAGGQKRFLLDTGLALLLEGGLEGLQVGLDQQREARVQKEARLAIRQAKIEERFQAMDRAGQRRNGASPKSMNWKCACSTKEKWVRRSWPVINASWRSDLLSSLANRKSETNTPNS
jgi:hypothetical protein